MGYFSCFLLPSTQCMPYFRFAFDIKYNNSTNLRNDERCALVLEQVASDEMKKISCIECEYCYNYKYYS